ncbi:MAG: histidinol-phosphatase [Spirochaetes bacterium]|nr:histidinol-phosphatase [Spirochaetota bacterium]
MIRQNYHTHCNLCDGNNSIIELVEEAIKFNIEILGFSSHAPLPFFQDWVLTNEKLIIYFNEIEKAIKDYQDKITIKKSLEVDFIPGISSPQIFKEIYNLDYVIGSVHFLPSDEDNYLTVDGEDNDFKLILKTGFNNNIKKMVEYYYFLIEQMCIQNKIDIIGHFDLIKKNNKNSAFFDENENWYLQIVENTLKNIKIKSSNIPIFEINTGGIARGYIKEPYPSLKIISLLKKYNFDITVNSDCHNKENLLFYYDEIYNILKDIGFMQIMKLNEYNKWIGVKI